MASSAPSVNSFMQALRQYPVLFFACILLGIAFFGGSLFFLSAPISYIGALGTVVFFVLIVVLILRLVQDEARLQLTVRQQEGVLHHVPAGIVAYDADFHVILFNAAAEAIFEVPAQHVLGMRLDASQSSDVHLRMLIQVVFSSLAPVVITRSEPGVYPQVTDVSFDDVKKDLRVITDRICDEKNTIVGFIKIITDTTREQELLKSKTEFIAVAAHQLRTPLTAINWGLEALESESLTVDQKNLVDTAFAAVKNALGTVNNLLDVSKIEEGRFGYNIQQTDLLPFLDELLIQVQTLAKQYAITLYFDRPLTPLPPVYIDAQKMSMVFYNLLDNAIKYNVEHGSVTIAVRALSPDPFVEITIKDTGIGIPPNQIDKLFTKFFRADNAVKTVADGTGLGLYIVRNIIRRHGGEVRVDSELNRGTTFHITLPTDASKVPHDEFIGL